MKTTEPVILAHRIQLDPTAEQELAFRKSCGCARFTWNWGLAAYKAQLDAKLKPNVFEIKKQFNKIKEAEFPWIKESPKDANQQPFANLKAALTRFFKKTAIFPKFKRKGEHDSFYIANDKFEVSGGCAR